MNADPRHQILGILSFSDRERTLPPSTEISVLTFEVRKRKKGFESQHEKVSYLCDGGDGLDVRHIS